MFTSRAQSREDKYRDITKGVEDAVDEFINKPVDVDECILTKWLQGAKELRSPRNMDCTNRDEAKFMFTRKPNEEKEVEVVLFYHGFNGGGQNGGNGVNQMMNCVGVACNEFKKMKRNCILHVTPTVLDDGKLSRGIYLDVGMVYTTELIMQRYTLPLLTRLTEKGYKVNLHLVGYSMGGTICMLQLMAFANPHCVTPDAMLDPIAHVDKECAEKLRLYIKEKLQNTEEPYDHPLARRELYRLLREKGVTALTPTPFPQVTVKTVITLASPIRRFSSDSRVFHEAFPEAFAPLPLVGTFIAKLMRRGIHHFSAPPRRPSDGKWKPTPQGKLVDKKLQKGVMGRELMTLDDATSLSQLGTLILCASKRAREEGRLDGINIYHVFHDIDNIIGPQLTGQCVGHQTIEKTAEPEAENAPNTDTSADASAGARAHARAAKRNVFVVNTLWAQDTPNFCYPHKVLNLQVEQKLIWKASDANGEHNTHRAVVGHMRFKHDDGLDAIRARLCAIIFTSLFVSICEDPDDYVETKLAINVLAADAEHAVEAAHEAELENAAIADENAEQTLEDTLKAAEAQREEAEQRAKEQGEEISPASEQKAASTASAPGAQERERVKGPRSLRLHYTFDSLDGYKDKKNKRQKR